MSGAKGRAPLAMIAAMTPSRVIGSDGGIPWHYPEDMKHFVRVTKGHAVIMGRATFESIGKPLKGRRNIVISSRKDLVIDGCEVTSSLEDAIARARQEDDEPLVIGGARVYEAALPLATRLYLTYIREEHPGDVYFPELDPEEWVESDRREADGLSFVTLDRR